MLEADLQCDTRQQKNRKVGPRCNEEAPWGQRGFSGGPIFEDLGPWAPTRAKPVKSSKVLKLASWLVGKEKLASWNGNKASLEDLTRPKARGLANFDIFYCS